MNADEAINRWAFDKIHAGKAEAVFDWDERGRTRRWKAEQRQLVTLDDVISVEFSSWDIGYCETCSYIVSGVVITTKKRGGQREWRVGDVDFKTIMQELIDGATT